MQQGPNRVVGARKERMPYGGEALSCSITAPRRRGRPFIGENPPVTLHSVFSLVFVRIISRIMKYTWLVLASCVVLVLAELLPGTSAGPYLEDGEFEKFLCKCLSGKVSSERGIPAMFSLRLFTRLCCFA